MMQLDVATSAARDYMDEHLEEPGPRRLAITRAELRSEGWLFFYSSAAFVKSGSFVDALGGDTPILVRPDGEVATLGAEVGRDPATVSFATRAEVRPGELTVSVHGTPGGYATGATTNNVAAAIRSHPDYVPGQPICMYSCYAGSNGTAANLAAELGSLARPSTDVAGLAGRGKLCPVPRSWWNLGDVPVRRLGDFRDFSIEPTSAPSISASLDETVPAQLRRLVAFYLIQGGAVRYTMERLPDVIDGEVVYLSGGLQTDGEWFWRSDLAHYVMKYGLTLPSEFLDNASANGWSPPVLSEEERGELAAELRRQGE